MQAGNPAFGAPFQSGDVCCREGETHNLERPWNPEPVCKIEKELVDVTPAPVFPGLEGLNNRMIGRVEMLGGMRILRIVTATDMSTDKTDTQVHPGITHFQALLAAIGARCNLSYLVKMTTLFWHILLLSFFYENSSGRDNYCSLHGLRVAFPVSSRRHMPCRKVLFE